MSWLSKLSEWFNDHVVEPLLGREIQDAPQLEIESPSFDPIGPVEREPQPIEFDRQGVYVPLEPTHTLQEHQIEDALSYMPDGLSPNMQNWTLQMIHEELQEGAEWDDIMDDIIFDFWEWYRENYEPGAA